MTPQAIDGAIPDVEVQISPLLNEEGAQDQDGSVGVLRRATSVTPCIHNHKNTNSNVLKQVIKSFDISYGHDDRIAFPQPGVRGITAQAKRDVYQYRYVIVIQAYERTFWIIYSETA